MIKIPGLIKAGSKESILFVAIITYIARTILLCNNSFMTLSYRNQSNDLQSKSRHRFPYHRDLRHEWLKWILFIKNFVFQRKKIKNIYTLKRNYWFWSLVASLEWPKQKIVLKITRDTEKISKGCIFLDQHFSLSRVWWCFE